MNESVNRSSLETIHSKERSASKLRNGPVLNNKIETHYVSNNPESLKLKQHRDSMPEMLPDLKLNQPLNSLQKP